MSLCKDWFEAIRCNDTKELMRLVNKANVNTRAKEAGSSSQYTPVQFLARISPGNSPAMLEYLLSLGADLTLKAKTVDCVITTYCTTIGNLASYRIDEKGKWWSSKADQDIYEQELNKVNNIYYPYGEKEAAIEAVKNKYFKGKCHPKTNFMYDALSQLKQEGLEVPGLNIKSWVTRGARKLIRGTGNLIYYTAKELGTSPRGGSRKSKKSKARERKQTRRN
jgi:hypothetical protein